MKKRQNTHIWETDKVYDVSMTSFLEPKHLKFRMRTFHKTVFAEVKGGGRFLPWPEGDFYPGLDRVKASQIQKDE